MQVWDIQWISWQLIGMKIRTHGPQRMNPVEVGEELTLPLRFTFVVQSEISQQLLSKNLQQIFKIIEDKFLRLVVL